VFADVVDEQPDRVVLLARRCSFADDLARREPSVRTREKTGVAGTGVPLSCVTES
jgi:hypothetical protein